MGRLDDYAKKRIVELRKAGLSFRKIKKVLELDNIRVTPQAIYLFLKRKNMDPGPLPGSSHPLPPRDQNSRLLALRRAGWEDEQLWDLLQESEVEPKESLESQPAGPRGETGAGQSWDGEEGIKIVSVRSLCEDGVAHPKDACSSEVPRASANSDAGIGLVAPGPVSQPASPHPLNRGRACMPSPRNSALIVKKKIVDRAIYLHKKRVQSSGPGPGLPDLKDSSPQVQDMSTQTRLPCASAQGLAEKLDAVQGAVQQVLQVLQMLTDQQSRLERQQEQQQRWQQQVLGTLQQLREPTHSQGPGARETQDLGNLGTLEGPNFCQFKMELL